MATRLAARHRLGRIRAMIAHHRSKKESVLATHDMASALDRWEGEGGAPVRVPVDDRLWAKAVYRVIEQLRPVLGFPRPPLAPHPADGPSPRL